MRAAVYIDIKLSHLMAQLLRNLHTYFVKHPNTFALAFPHLCMGAQRRMGDVVRVFAQHPDVFIGLTQWLSANHHLAPHVIFSAPIYVDTTKVIKWIEYRRYHITPQHSHLPACSKYHIELAKDVPYVRMRNRHGNNFMLRICALESVATTECYPTSYGLSGEKRFSLPMMR
jgi:hypothetical protein